MLLFGGAQARREQSEVGSSELSKVEDYNLESRVFHPFDAR